MNMCPSIFFFFFFNDTATTEIYTLSLHDALPIFTILTVLTAALLLQVVASYAAQTAARGSAIMTVDALNMVLIAVLVFLLMRQVMPIAAALAGGMALSSFGSVSRLVNWGLHQGTRATLVTTAVFSNLVARPRRSERIATTVARTF